MKKYILLIIVSIFLIYILICCYDKSERIINKKYYDDKNSIKINYPYFNDSSINSYINNYLNNIIYNRGNFNLYIDYDYRIEDDTINLVLYTCKYSDNVIGRDAINIIVDSNMNYVVNKYGENIRNYCLNYE